jgi:hypothetical protein
MTFYELGKTQKKKQVYGTAPEPDQFQLIPSCPPSTITTLLAGLMQRNAIYWFWVEFNVQIPDMEIDWSDLGETIQDDEDPLVSEILTCTFDNAYWYIGFIFGFNWDWVRYRENRDHALDDPDYVPVFIYNGGKTEYETAAEAEAEVDYLLNGKEQIGEWWESPMWGMVLRNNGTIGEAGAVLPIEPQNRGNSYIYRDARQRWPIMA